MSYILNSENTKFNFLILKEIQNHTFFRVNNVRNSYIQKVLNKRFQNFEETNKRSISCKIGKIVAELILLGIVEKYN
ncbi:hypothetical protein LCGC14_2184440, partial [marine sediment metagenome]